MKNRKKIIIVGSLILVALLSVVGILRPLAQDKSKIQQQTKKQDKKKNFPMTDYSSQDKVSSEERKMKSNKYDASLGVLLPNLPEDNTSILALDWAQDLVALPVNKSELIVLGKVVDANAYLSNKKNTVYSEFNIEIEDIFKNTSEQKFKNDKFVTAEREGGIVRFPSGYEHWHRVAGQQMPSVNSKYVFFLTNDFQIYGHQKKSFYLLTAYELREGKVFPLDDPGDSYPIVSVYNGKDESILLSDLQKALQ